MATDRRDSNVYTVRYINGACWMTQNLRITKSTGQADWTISKTDSNFNNVSTWNIHGADLLGSSYSYTQAQSHVADATNVSTAASNGYTTTLDGKEVTTDILGVWYNFCAVSANNSNGCNNSGSYTPATGDVTGDICPAGWHLPTYSTTTTGDSLIGNIYGLRSAYSSDNPTLFNPVYGGFYFNGTLLNSGTYGHWWSATAYSASYQYRLYYYNGSLITSSDNKVVGLYVRCVRTS